ncbi:MAG: hypothetical protein RBR32_06705 [Bacteroidales bacterium]|nr:hypothetical protein [Bacteroidales bacterium]
MSNDKPVIELKDYYFCTECMTHYRKILYPNKKCPVDGHDLKEVGTMEQMKKRGIVNK